MRAGLRTLPRRLGMLALGLLLLHLDVALAALMVTRLNMNDFGKFFYSTVYFLAGRDMYAPSPATTIPHPALSSMQFLNMNPPHAHLPLLLLVPLGPLPALIVWTAASIACLVATLWIIGRELGLTLGRLNLGMILVAGLAFAGTTSTVVTGQLSLLILLPITLAWVAARHDRPMRAGLLLGSLISVKPFLLIFVPYFVLRRRWRFVFAAAAAIAVWFSIGLVVFGVEAHRRWLGALSGVQWTWAVMNASVEGGLARMLAPAPLLTPLAVRPALIHPLWMAAAACVGTVTLACAVFDESPRQHDRAFALLLVAALLISPLGWVYYLWLPLGPLVALVTFWNRQAAPVGSGRVVTARTVLAMIGTLAFVWPHPSLLIFQPSGWASLVFGSLYLWGTLAVWLALVVDWHLDGGMETLGAAIRRLAPRQSDILSNSPVRRVRRTAAAKPQCARPT